MFIKTMAALNLVTSMEAHPSDSEYLRAVRRGSAYIASLVNPRKHGRGIPRAIRNATLPKYR